MQLSRVINESTPHQLMTEQMRGTPDKLYGRATRHPRKGRPSSLAETLGSDSMLLDVHVIAS